MYRSIRSSIYFPHPIFHLHIYYIQFKFSNEISFLYVILVVNCGSLENPIGGVVTVSTTTFNSTATYICNNDRVLIGEDSRQCQSDKTWSGTSPTCVLGKSISPIISPSHPSVHISVKFMLNIKIITKWYKLVHNHYRIWFNLMHS